MQSKKLGFNREQVIFMTMMFLNPKLWGQQEAIKETFTRHPGIRANQEDVIPGHSEPIRMRMLNGDWDFLDLLGVDVVSGRYFLREAPRDSSESFLLNETAVKMLGWDPRTAIGKRFEWPFLERRGQIIGVVKDFHTGSMHAAIEPTFMVFRRNKQGNLLVKIRPDDVPETLDFIRETWRQFMPNHPFRPEFIDDEVNRLYRRERQLGEMFTLFFGLAIFIACLGLLALATFSAEQRTKEIGIRKSVGADVSTIVLLLARGFLKPVVAASVIGWPVAYWVMTRWLDNFAYRIDLGAGPFLIGAGIAVLIALSTVGYQAMRAARVSPVEALRYE